MQRIVSVFVLCFAVAAAQTRLTTLNTIANGTTATGTWTNTAATPFPTAPAIYQLWVPNNAAGVSITLSNNAPTSGCTWLDININLVSPPCYNEDFPSPYNTDIYYCSQYDYVDDVYYGDTESYAFENSYSSNGFKFVVGTYWYIAVQPESDYIGEVCSYSLNVQINQTCAPDSISVYDSADNFCAPEMNVSNNFNYSTTVSGSQLTNYYQLFHTQVPENTGSITVSLISSVDLETYGASFYGPSYSYNDCEESSSSTSNGGYNLTMICPVPLPGDFYLAVEPYYSESSAFNYTLQVTTQVCGTGFAGVNCMYPLTYLTLANFTNANTITLTNLNDTNTDIYNLNYNYNYRYFVFDTQNLTVATPALVVSAVSDKAAYLEVRAGNAPYYDVLYDTNQEQEIETTAEEWIYIYADFLVQQKQYFGVYCYDSVACNINIKLNATNLIDTSTSATSATSATTATTTSASSGVSTTGTTGTVVTTGVTGTPVTTGVTGTVVTTAVTGTVVTTGSASTLVASLAAIFVAALLI